MNNAKEFQGKNLDEAIQNACVYFGVDREKLEIEIVHDAKTGIFGLVSVKKACIKASRVQVQAVFNNVDAPGEVDKAPQKASVKVPKAAAKQQKNDVKQVNEQPTELKKIPKKVTRKPAEAQPKVDHVEAEPMVVAESACAQPVKAAREEKVDTGKKEAVAKGRRPAAKGRDNNRDAGVDTTRADATFESLQDLDIDSVESSTLSAFVLEAVTKLVLPIAEDATFEVVVADGRIRVCVRSEEASGLLVGREGQTLASIQYVVTRIVSKHFGGAVRLQIDAGNYRERQESKLYELAHTLAAKVKVSGKAQSTRPLSAYQRRLVHLALEEDASIQTSSKGDGAQRRVVVMLRKGVALEAPQMEEEAGNGVIQGTDLSADSQPI